MIELLYHRHYNLAKPEVNSLSFSYLLETFFLFCFLPLVIVSTVCRAKNLIIIPDLTSISHSWHVTKSCHFPFTNISQIIHFFLAILAVSALFQLWLISHLDDSNTPLNCLVFSSPVAKECSTAEISSRHHPVYISSVWHMKPCTNRVSYLKVIWKIMSYFSNLISCPSHWLNPHFSPVLLNWSPWGLGPWNHRSWGLVTGWWKKEL